jgi:hypothetical protein
MPNPVENTLVNISASIENIWINMFNNNTNINTNTNKSTPLAHIRNTEIPPESQKKYNWKKNQGTEKAEQGNKKKNTHKD